MNFSAVRILRATVRSLYNAWSHIGLALFLTAKRIGIAIVRVLQWASDAVVWLHSSVSSLIFSVFNASSLLFALFLPAILYFDPLDIIWCNLVGLMSERWVEVVRIACTATALMFSAAVAIEFIKEIRKGLNDATESEGDAATSGIVFSISQILGWVVTVFLLAYFLAYRLMIALGFISPSLASSLYEEIHGLAFSEEEIESDGKSNLEVDSSVKGWKVAGYLLCSSEVEKHWIIVLGIKRAEANSGGDDESWARGFMPKVARGGYSVSVDSTDLYAGMQPDMVFAFISGFDSRITAEDALRKISYWNPSAYVIKKCRTV